MKKILILILIFFSTLIVFKLSYAQKLNYISIGDSLIIGINSYNKLGYGYNDIIKTYLNENNLLRAYSNNHYNSSIDGLYKDIINNKMIIDSNHEYSIKKDLRESDLLVISIGMDEINYIYNEYSISKLYYYFDKMYNSMEKLIKEVKKYALKDIILIGYYNPTNLYTIDVDNFFAYVNNKYTKLCHDYNIYYIDIYEIIKGNKFLPNPNSYYLNNEGYNAISLLIKDYIDNHYLK